MVSPQPSIYPFGIRIDEPMAVVTDLLVSAVCFYAFYKLTKKNLPGRSQWYLRYYFLLIGIATFLGGVIGHGFLYALSFPWKLPGWTISMISVALIERSAISHARRLIKPVIVRTFLIVNIIELVIVMTVTMTTLDFFLGGVSFRIWTADRSLFIPRLHIPSREGQRQFHDVVSDWYHRNCVVGIYDGVFFTHLVQLHRLESHIVGNSVVCYLPCCVEVGQERGQAFEVNRRIKSVKEF